MYVIIVYDVAEKRVTKVNKFLKAYLTWRQNSVFEGEISKSQLEEVKIGLKEIINEEEDSILIYILPNNKILQVQKIGTDKSEISFII